MKTYFMFVFASFFAFIVFLNVGKCESKKQHIVKLTVTIENEWQLQRLVNEGHQPWRMNPVDVAYAAVSNPESDVKYEDCHIISRSDKEAWVRCTSSKENYVVYLKRLVASGGIWTAILIEIIPLENR